MKTHIVQQTKQQLRQNSNKHVKVCKLTKRTTKGSKENLKTTIKNFSYTLIAFKKNTNPKRIEKSKNGKFKKKLREKCQSH